MTALPNNLLLFSRLDVSTHRLARYACLLFPVSTNFPPPTMINVQSARQHAVVCMVYEAHLGKLVGRLRRVCIFASTFAVWRWPHLHHPVATGRLQVGGASCVRDRMPHLADKATAMLALWRSLCRRLCWLMVLLQLAAALAPAPGWGRWSAVLDLSTPYATLRVEAGAHLAGHCRRRKGPQGLLSSARHVDIP